VTQKREEEEKKESELPTLQEEERKALSYLALTTTQAEGLLKKLATLQASFVITQQNASNQERAFQLCKSELSDLQAHVEFVTDSWNEALARVRTTGAQLSSIENDYKDFTSRRRETATHADSRKETFLHKALGSAKKEFEKAKKAKREYYQLFLMKNSDFTGAEEAPEQTDGNFTFTAESLVPGAVRRLPTIQNTYDEEHKRLVSLNTDLSQQQVNMASLEKQIEGIQRNVTEIETYLSRIQATIMDASGASERVLEMKRQEDELNATISTLRDNLSMLTSLIDGVRAASRVLSENEAVFAAETANDVMISHIAGIRQGLTPKEKVVALWKSKFQTEWREMQESALTVWRHKRIRTADVSISDAARRV
jgi:predicted  nucleic acid-binding Zn-ribbon protein